MPEFIARNFKLPIEIPLFLIFFALLLSDPINTNLIIFRTCYVTLGYNKSDCALLGSKHTNNETNHLEKIVQPYATVIHMVQTLTQAIFSAILCLFVGPWSDRFGRKPMLIIPMIGYTLNYLLLAIFAAFSNLSPWLLLICSIPTFITGGSSSYLTVFFCYITDITNETNRGLRMGTFEAFMTLGVFLGYITSSYLLSATGYSIVFLISVACCLLNLIFTVFLMPESLTNRETEVHFKGLFQLTNIKELMKTTFKKRQNNQRCVILYCVLMLSVFITVLKGDSAVKFFYLREKFHWSLEKYTLYSGAYNIIWISGAIIAVYFLHKLLKIPEIIMILVGFISMLNGSLMMGLANIDWDVYAAAFFSCLGAGLSPMVRTLVSKIVPNDEVGKIFALIVSSEALIGTSGSPIYTAIYNATIKTNPSVYNFISASIFFVEILITVGIMVMGMSQRSNDEIYDQLINEQTSEHQEEVTH